MIKTGQIEKLGRYVVAMRNRSCFFNRLRFKQGCGSWKRKRENSTASASTQEGRMEEEKKLVLLSFGEERIGGA